MKTLSDQVKFLSLNTTGSIHHLPQSSQSHNSPGPLPPVQGPHGQSHLRQQQNIQPVNPPQQAYPHPPYTQQQPAPPLPHQQPPVIHNTWFPPTIAAPQASHPATIPQPPPAQPPQERATPPIKPDEWDEVYLGVLQTQDATKLQDLLGHTNPDLIMPLSGPCLVSQAVILTLVHRVSHFLLEVHAQVLICGSQLSAVVGETQPSEEAFKNSLWWLQRAVAVLRPDVSAFQIKTNLILKTMNRTSLSSILSLELFQMFSNFYLRPSRGSGFSLDHLQLTVLETFRISRMS